MNRVQQISVISMIYIGVIYLVTMLLTERDSTDPIDGRSNLIILTDNLSGCEYLSSAYGGLTPRIVNGKHNGCRNEAFNLEF